MRTPKSGVGLASPGRGKRTTPAVRIEQASLLQEGHRVGPGCRIGGFFAVAGVEDGPWGLARHGSLSLINHNVGRPVSARFIAVLRS